MSAARSRSRLAAFSLGAALALLAWPSRAADDLPAWLEEAIAADVAPILEAAQGEGEPPAAVVLHDESRVAIQSEERQSRRVRRAVRFLGKGARERARVAAHYYENGDDLRDFSVWLIQPDGDVKTYGKKDAVTRGDDRLSFHTEGKNLIVDLRGSVLPGTVVAWEYAMVREASLYDQAWRFQDTVPARRSRFELTLPPGWSIEERVFNGQGRVEAEGSAGRYAWTARDLPPVKPEPGSPPFVKLAAWMGVSVIAPAKAGEPVTWATMADRLSSLMAPYAAVDETVAQKARELTRGREGLLDKAEAIGRYVQGTSYYAVGLNLGQGGGYQPFPAPESLKKGFGDCKDKTILSRALLKAVGIESHSAVVNSGLDRDAMAAWPALRQFNHCILAIPVGDEVSLPAAAEAPGAGRFLFFDPTDSTVPLGELPFYLQGQRVLIDHPGIRSLVPLPVAPPERNRVEREVEAALYPDGYVEARVVTRRSGSMSQRRLRSYAYKSDDQFVADYRNSLANDLRSADLSLEIDEARADAFATTASLAARQFARSHRGQLLVVPPVFASRSEWRYPQAAKGRETPYRVPSQSLAETVRYELPEGFVVDELVAEAADEREFGAYRVEAEVTEGTLVFRRSFAFRPMTLPPERFGEFADFCDAMLAADAAPAVLARN